MLWQALWPIEFIQILLHRNHHAVSVLFLSQYRDSQAEEESHELTALNIHDGFLLHHHGQHIHCHDHHQLLLCPPHPRPSDHLRQSHQPTLALLCDVPAGTWGNPALHEYLWPCGWHHHPPLHLRLWTWTLQLQWNHPIQLSLLYFRNHLHDPVRGQWKRWQWLIIMNYYNSSKYFIYSQICLELWLLTLSFGRFISRTQFFMFFLVYFPLKRSLLY